MSVNLSRDIGTLKQFIHAVRTDTEQSGGFLSLVTTVPTRPGDEALAEAADHLIQYILSGKITEEDNAN